MLTILLVVLALVGGGLSGGHYIRGRILARNALAAGKAALEQKDWPAACKYLQRYLTKKPNDQEMLVQFAEAHLHTRPRKSENYAHAVRSYRRLVRLRPGDSAASNRLLKLYFASGDGASAEDLCRSRLKSNRDDMEASLGLGRALIVQGKVAEARKNVLQPLVGTHPEQVQAYFLLSEGEMQDRDAKEDVKIKNALEWLHKSVVNNVSSAEARARRARFMLNMPKKDKAGATTDLLAAGPALRPGDINTRLEMAEGWLALFNYTTAQKELDEIQQIEQRQAVAFEEDLDRDDRVFAQLKIAATLVRKAGSNAAPEDFQKAAALADRALQELWGDRRTAFLRYAVDLYIFAGKPQAADLCLQEFRKALLELNRHTPGEEDELLLLLDAKVAMAEGRPYDVINLLDQSKLRDPRGTNTKEMLKLLAQAYEGTGQIRRAVQIYENVISRWRGDPLATTRLINIYIAQRRWSDALRHARENEDQLPPEIEFKLLEIRVNAYAAAVGVESTSPGVMEALQRELARLRESYKDMVEIRTLQAFILVYKRQIPKAINELNDAIKESREPLMARLYLAELYGRNGQRDKAIEVCRSALPKHPDVASLPIALADLLLADDKPAEARKVMNDAIPHLVGAEKNRAVTTLSNYLLTHNERPAAIDMLKKLAAEQTNDVQVRMMLLSLPETQKDDVSIKELIAQIKGIEGAKGLRWRVEQARYDLRNTNWKANHKQIIELLTQCAEADPGWSVPVVVVGRLYERLGQEPQAEMVYHRLLDSYPDVISVADRLLRLLERQGRYAEASKILDRLSSPLAGLREHRVNVHIGLAKYDTAIDELEKQIATDLKDAASRVLLARVVFTHRGDVNRALKLLDEARALNGDLLLVITTRVLILNAADRDAEAVALLNAEVQQHSDFRTHLLRAKYYAASRRSKLAEKDYVQLTTFKGSEVEAYKLLGGFYEQNKEMDKAITAWEDGLKSDPNDNELMHQLVKGLVNHSQEAVHQRGLAMLKDMLRQQRDDAALLAIYAGDLLNSRAGAEPTPETINQAIVLYEKVVKINPHDETAHLQLIKHASDRGELATASRLAQQAVGANPGNIELLLTQARLESRQRHWDVAKTLAARVLDYDRKNVDARNLLVSLAILTRDFDAAETMNQQVLQLEPHNETALLASGTILAAKNLRDEGIRYLDKFCQTEIGKKNMRALLLLADLYRLKGDMPRAEEWIQRAATVAPDDSTVFLARLQWYASQQRYDEILIQLADYRRAHPVFSDVLIPAASIFAYAGAERYLQEAKALFTQYVSFKPDRIDGYLGLAQIAQQLGDSESAEQAYRKVLSLDANHEQALNNLAWTLSESLHRPDEAMTVVNRAVLQYPNNPHLLNTRGVVLVRQKRFKEARIDLEHCLDLSKDLPTTQAKTLLYLGRLDATQGEPVLAGKRLKVALEIDRKTPVFTDAERMEIRGLMANPTSRLAGD